MGSCPGTQALIMCIRLWLAETEFHVSQGKAGGEEEKGRGETVERRGKGRHLPEPPYSGLFEKWVLELSQTGFLPVAASIP